MSLYPSIARPRTLEQAAELLDNLASGKVLIAGGQELMPSVNRGVLQPDVYVDIGGLKELQGIALSDDGATLCIGALTVHRELQQHELVREHAPLLAEAARKAGGGRQVHNRGTIGGNVVSMHPLYDIAPSLLALGAEVEMLCGGARSITPLADVLSDTRHGLGTDAILVGLRVPVMAPGCGYAYEKLKNSGGAYGSANAAATVSVDGRGITAVRIIVGAVAEQLVDASDAAAFLVGQSWNNDAATRLQSAVSALIQQPLSDQQGHAEWRQAMAGVVAARACAAACAMANDGTREGAH